MFESNGCGTVETQVLSNQLRCKPLTSDAKVWSIISVITIKNICPCSPLSGNFEALLPMGSISQSIETHRPIVITIIDAPIVTKN